jgi:nucleotide-binding universal stress UspA family protein
MGKKLFMMYLYVIPQKGKNADEAIQHILEKIKLDASLNHIELKTEIIQSESPVINEITEYAKNTNADLLVVGIRAASEFRFMLGSKASGVISYAHCPVVVVK